MEVIDEDKLEIMGEIMQKSVSPQRRYVAFVERYIAQRALNFPMWRRKRVFTYLGISMKKIALALRLGPSFTSSSAEELKHFLIALIEHGGSSLDT